jgi:hypothetical protein
MVNTKIIARRAKEPDFGPIISVLWWAEMVWWFFIWGPMILLYMYFFVTYVSAAPANVHERTDPPWLIMLIIAAVCSFYIAIRCSNVRRDVARRVVQETLETGQLSWPTLLAASADRPNLDMMRKIRVDQHDGDQLVELVYQTMLPKER